LQDFRQAHFPDHEAADLLEQAQLPLGLLQAPFEISGFRHSFIIALAQRGAVGLQSRERARINDGEGHGE
jgi:hypothetical protein